MSDLGKFTKGMYSSMALTIKDFFFNATKYNYSNLLQKLKVSRLEIFSMPLTLVLERLPN